MLIHIVKSKKIGIVHINGFESETEKTTYTKPLWLEIYSDKQLRLKFVIESLYILQRINLRALVYKSLFEKVSTAYYSSYPGRISVMTVRYPLPDLREILQKIGRFRRNTDYSSLKIKLTVNPDYLVERIFAEMI